MRKQKNIINLLLMKNKIITKQCINQDAYITIIYKFRMMIK